MSNKISEDDAYVFKIDALVKSMDKEFGLDLIGLKSVVIYHLGLLHGGNNVKT